MKIISLTVTVCLLCVLLIPSSSASIDLSGAKAISISLLNQDPDPAIAGDIMEIYLGIENRGEIGRAHV